MFENFPYVNFHDLNLDWIISEIKKCYSPDNPPDAVVLSVNGETGDVVLYKDAIVRFPDTEAGTWNIFRKADDQDTGIQFRKNQPAQRIQDAQRYDMYDAGNPPPYPVTSVDGQTGTVTTWGNVGGQNMTFPVEADGEVWALRRDTPAGYLGIQFEIDESDDPCGYFILTPSGGVMQKIKILTPNDIPSSAGVVSINGEAGVVVLTGEDIDVSSDDSRSIAEAIEDIIDDEYQMDNSITYTERGDTATQNIPMGKYVLWKNNPYISIASIANGDALSSSNLVALDHGIVDSLLQTVNSQANQINTLNSKLTISSKTELYNSSIAKSSDTSWHSSTNNYLATLTDYKKLIINIGVHGALYNTFEFDVADIVYASIPVQVSCYWNADNLGMITIQYNALRFDVTAKTKDFAFDYVLYGVK